MIPIEASGKKPSSINGGGLTSRSQSCAHGFRQTAIKFTWLGFSCDGTIIKLPVGEIKEMIDINVDIVILECDIRHMCIGSKNF